MTRSRRRLAFRVILFVAFAIRLPSLFQPGLWADEVFSLAMATGHSLEHPAAAARPERGDFVEGDSAQPAVAWRGYLTPGAAGAGGVGSVIRAVRISDTSPPLYYLLLRGWIGAFGTGDASLRGLSLACALLALPLIWTLGRWLGGARTAVFATSLFAVSPLALFYSSEVRMYALLWVLALGFICATVSAAARGLRGRAGLAWLLTGVAGLYTHYFFAFVLASGVVWLWLRPGRARRRDMLFALVATAILVAPWYVQLPQMFGAARLTKGWLDGFPGWRHELLAPFVLAKTLLSGRFAERTWGLADPLTVAALAALAIAALIRGPRAMFRHRPLLIWLWLGAVCGGLVAFDIAQESGATIVRYTIAGMPAAMLLAGLAASRAPRPAGAALMLCLAATWLPSLGRELRHSRDWQNYALIARGIRESGAPPELVIVHSIPSGVIGLARYLEPDTPVAAWVGQLGQRRVPDDAVAITWGKRRIVLVTVHTVNDSARAEAWLRAHGTLTGKSDHALYFTLADGSRAGLLADSGAVRR